MVRSVLTCPVIVSCYFAHNSTNWPLVIWCRSQVYRLLVYEYMHVFTSIGEDSVHVHVLPCTIFGNFYTAYVQHFSWSYMYRYMYSHVHVDLHTRTCTDIDMYETCQYQTATLRSIHRPLGASVTNTPLTRQELKQRAEAEFHRIRAAANKGFFDWGLR